MFGGASSFSGQVDAVFLYITALTVAFLIFITALMVYFVIRYSRKAGARAEDIHGNTRLEVAWTVIPLGLFLTMFYFGWTNYRTMRNVPRDAMVVKVTGRQWSWSFTYPNGRKTDQLFLAVNRPVKLLLESADVLHGFYIPAFRIKEDVVPGKQNYTWFQPTELGSFDIECTVICGVSHSYMLSKANVLTEEQFKTWYFGPEKNGAPLLSDAGAAGVAAQPAGSPDPTRGERAYRLKGCVSCHSIDGARLVGPSFKGIFGSKTTVLSNGQETTLPVDDRYLVDSIRQPRASVVKGYAPDMPTAELNDGELGDLIAYIKSLR